MVPSALTYLAPAKINLHLRVAAPEASGFHPLRSWMTTVGLCDELTARISDRDDPPITLAIDGHPTLAADSTNLVYRAAASLQPSQAIAIALHKRIPIGAGLGGGSSDAATTLVLVNELLQLGRSAADLHSIASTLGSDVPFFLHAPSAIAAGRGERLTPCPPPAIACHALLIFPPFGVSTPAAYRTLDSLRPGAPADVLDPFDVEAWAKLPSRELLPLLVNDLEPAAFTIEPRLAQLRLDLESTLDRIVRMSGSGSTLFTLYDDEAESLAAAERIRSRLGLAPSSQQAPDAVSAIAVSLGRHEIRAI